MHLRGLPLGGSLSGLSRGERQHGVAHLTDDPDVNPQDPRIHISLHDLNGGGVGVEWDVRACTTFEADYGRWKRLCPDQELPR